MVVCRDDRGVRRCAARWCCASWRDSRNSEVAAASRRWRCLRVGRAAPAASLVRSSGFSRSSTRMRPWRVSPLAGVILPNRYGSARSSPTRPSAARKNAAFSTTSRPTGRPARPRCCSSSSSCASSAATQDPAGPAWSCPTACSSAMASAPASRRSCCASSISTPSSACPMASSPRTPASRPTCFSSTAAGRRSMFLEHLPPEKLVEDIAAKEGRILQIMEEIKILLAKGP